ncbi:hypothetical protein AHMF7605_10400 [Adhaeribacter arboris]|uniref:Major tropism determinant N-terminal domain-containing protein n=1 Tax=Adhaeribacter arboris TaxID=2072846 RepID=A0A2T2YEL6_9BACT|nr:hypothetical protein [Adhaeribacter arboris]PSR53898.1 hypothetical protein AHMF7605_10400 [Adhaeribacter arboris]
MGIRTRQIEDGQITAPKIAAGANIETSKLADGTEFFKRDGSVLATGTHDMNNNKIQNVGTPTNTGDATNKTYVDSLIAGLSSAYKYRNVRAATTGNVNISNPGTAVFDTVTMAVDELLLVWQNTTQSQNGIYLFKGSAVPLVRAPNSDAWNEFPGSLVSVNEGAVHGDSRFFSPVNDGGTLGTTAITYTKDPTSGLTAANMVDRETPSGSINGSNTAFTLANTPVSGSEHVYLNGILQLPGGIDYTISGTSITMATAPLSGEWLRVSYRK